MADAGGGGGGGGDAAGGDGAAVVQDRHLPVANIARIMKTTLPDSAKIAKDAKDALQLCVSEFISIITSEASDKCLRERRKTINGDDLLWAMRQLGFDAGYQEPLKLYLAKFREAEALASQSARGGGGGSGGGAAAAAGGGTPPTGAAGAGSSGAAS